MKFRTDGYHLLTPDQVLFKGLTLAQIDPEGCKSRKRMIYKFEKEYGMSPLDVASVWYDLVVGPGEDDGLSAKDISAKGFTMFLMAINFLWKCPKNCTDLSNKFHIGERQCRGQPFWDWVEKIAALKRKKIRFEFGEEVYLLSVDGVDFDIWEPKHDTINKDPRQMSHKSHHGAVKYEIAISVHRPQVMWISGPHSGGKNDYTIFKEGLQQMIPDGKLGIADRGYGRESNKKVSLPSKQDSKELHNYKARVRCRHETFNGRIKKFDSMSKTWRYGAEKHGYAFEAVVVLCQYTMENGFPLYDA